MDILIHNFLCSSQLFPSDKWKEIGWLIQRMETVLELLVYRFPRKTVYQYLPPATGFHDLVVYAK